MIVLIIIQFFRRHIDILKQLVLIIVIFYHGNPKGESINLPSTFYKTFNPSVDYDDTRERVIFNGNCIKQQKITFNHEKIVNIYTIYDTDDYHHISSYPTLENCLFGAAKLTTHIDVDLYKNYGHAIGFDRKGFFFNS